jgi:hypothetical protein
MEAVAMDEKTEFKFSELSEKAKEKAREWYRECVSQDWEPDLDDAATCLSYLGFEVNKESYSTRVGTRQRWAISYSIGYCQSDFADFAAEWKAEAIDMAGLLAYAPIDTELHKMCARAMALMLRHPLAVGAVRRRNHGGSECEYAYRNPDDGQAVDDVDFALQHDLEAIAKDICAWLYKQLRDEYEYQTSDEQVIEGIEANEYDFDEDGERV